MRILYLGNNWLGYRVFKWLVSQNENIVGLATHPVDGAQPQMWTDEILEVAPRKTYLIDGSMINHDPMLQNLNADICVAVFFGYILDDQFIQSFPHGVINLHPSYLPFNRGKHPNIWSIVDQTPAGITLHYIDKGIDTGDIIEQRMVKVEPYDTGKTLYLKLENTGMELFTDTWPLIKSGKAPRKKQEGLTTHHFAKDLEMIDEIDLDKTCTARDLINILRARTFPPYKGVYFIEDGKKVYVNLDFK